jgi:carbamoyl-phosphate synthase large subunit
MDVTSENAAMQMVDHQVIAPPYGPEELEFIYELCKKERIDVLLPLNADNECLPLLEWEEKEGAFSKIGTKLVGVGFPVDSYRKCVFKDETYKFLKANGLNHPEFFTPKSIEEFEKAVEKLGYPEKNVLIKPITGAGNRGLRILDSSFDLFGSVTTQKPDSSTTNLEAYTQVLRMGETFPNILVMEYLPGKEYTVYCLCDKGEPLYIIPLERVKTTAGMSLVAEVDLNAEVIAYCKQIIQALKLHGNVDLQMKYSEEGKPVLYEVNPRYSASIILSYAAGVNLAYFGILQALGQEIPKVDVKDKVRMIRYADEVFVDGSEVFRVGREHPPQR